MKKCLVHFRDQYTDNSTLFGGSESRYKSRRDWKLRLKKQYVGF